MTQINLKYRVILIIALAIFMIAYTLWTPQRPKSDCLGFMTVMARGRLGNQMSEYASLFLNAKDYHFKPIITQRMHSALIDYFPNIKLPTAEQDAAFSRCYPDTFWSKISWIFFFSPYQKASWTSMSLDELSKDPNKFDFWQSTNIYLNEYPNDLDKISQHIKDIKTEFQFSKEYVDQAQSFLHLKRNQYLRKNDLPEDTEVTFVNVHARRKDYPKQHKNTNARVLVTEAYFQSAMERMKDDLKKEGKENVVFIMSSDDLVWCFEHFSSEKDIFLLEAYVAEFRGDEKAVLDLVTLGNCNHSIISYGTFGTWAALLSGGKVIVADGFYPNSSRLPKNWTALRDPCIDDDLNMIC